MIDLETGTISPLPTGGRGRGEGYWDICYSAFQPSGVEHRANSKLLVVRCADVVGSDGGSYIRTSYYVYDNGSFEKLRSTVGRERVF